METPVLSPDQDFSLDENGGHGLRKNLLLLDASLTIQAATASFYSAFQVAPQETIGKKLVELGHSQWNIPALLTLLNKRPEVEFDDLEMEADFPALGRKKMLVSARGLLGGENQSGMVLLSIRDVTGQRPSHLEAGDLPAQGRVRLASLGYALIVTDPGCRITFINSRAETLTGWSHNDALRNQLNNVFNIVSERSSEPVASPIARSIREGTAVGLEKYTVLVSRDGTERPIDGHAAQILDAAGSPAGAVLVFEDISNRRKAERETEISEVRYRRLFESAHDGILILDAATAKVLDVNPFLSDLLGYPKEHFLGRELWEIGVLSDAETSKGVITTLQKHGRIRYDDLPLQHKDGRHFPVEFVSNVYPEGRRNVIQCNIRDITERKRVAQDLADARQEAENANRSKSDFLANMSHEIRTPMGAILGFANMLLTRSPEECARIGCVQIIQRNSLHLLELINEILDLSKVEAGQMKVERVTCGLPELLAEIISLMRPRAAEKGLGFNIIFEGPIPRLIWSDPMRLRQILVNLVGNAVKFTETGKIDLRVTDEGGGGPNIALRVDVIDSGIGMTLEQLDRLFLPFTQGDASITRKFGGTGLGLTISRQLAKLLDGDVTVVSQPHKGSTFTLRVDGGSRRGVELLEGLTEATLPVKVDQIVQAAIHLQGHILLVEDGADNQRLFRMQLGDAGALVTSALDGRIAVDLAATQAFDLILMDMQMPVMDGYAATRELRRMGLTMPVIALTAYAMAEDREKCLACGCNAYLTKPVLEETLLRTVNKYLGKDVTPLPNNSPAAPVAAVLHPPASQPDASSRGNDSGPIRSSHADNPRVMQIVPEFVASLPGKVHKLLDLVERQDLMGLQRMAHQLLGTCGGYGFAEVSEPARKVEQSIKAGRPLPSIAPEINSLISLIRRIDGYDESQEKVAVQELVT